MSQFKRLVEKVLELNQAGLSENEIAVAVQCSRGVVQYVLDTYAEGAVAV